MGSKAWIGVDLEDGPINLEVFTPCCGEMVEAGVEGNLRCANCWKSLPPFMAEALRPGQAIELLQQFGLYAAWWTDPLEAMLGALDLKDHIDAMRGHAVEVRLSSDRAHDKTQWLLTCLQLVAHQAGLQACDRAAQILYGAEAWEVRGAIDGAFD